MDFDLSEVILKGKQNFATRIAGLVLQAVNDNKKRHKALQRFMLCNDSVTVAVEVPVYMDKYDLEHLQDGLKFKLPFELEKTLTGHIDILQIRNGAVHILDYKPNSSAGKKRGLCRRLKIQLSDGLYSQIHHLRDASGRPGWTGDGGFLDG